MECWGGGRGGRGGKPKKENQGECMTNKPYSSYHHRAYILPWCGMAKVGKLYIICLHTSQAQSRCRHIYHRVSSQEMQSEQYLYNDTN